MTYRVAHVRFSKSGQAYPVNCHRKDILKGDIVVIEMVKKQALKVAEVDRIEFLNWKCSNNLICKRSEFHKKNGRVIVKRDPPKGDSIETFSDLFGALKSLRWTRLIPESKLWNAAFAKSSPHLSGLVLFRKNGIDFQIFDSPEIPGASGGKVSVSVTAGRCFTRNWYYHSGIDLFDFTLSFAKELDRDFANIEPYLTGIGQKPPKPPKPEMKRSEVAELRDALNGGTGEPVYLCDGVWL